LLFLTPKFKDVNTLVSMLTYIDKPSIDVLWNSEKIDQYTTLYAPPVDEFQLELINIPAAGTITLPKLIGPSILLTLHGNGSCISNSTLNFESGTAIFVNSDHSIEIHAATDLKIFRASCSQKALK